MKVCFYRFFLFLIIFVASQKIGAQNKAFYVRGQADLFAVGLHESITDNYSHLQLANMDAKLHFQPKQNLRFYAELKNQAMFGSFLKDYPGSSIYNFNRYDWLNLNFKWNDDTQLVAHSRIDQVWMHVQWNAIEIRLGRQLIHWGQTMVWNISDIFNTYTMAQMHDPIKQGSDAIRISWYPSPVSMVEFAAKLNFYNELTTAVMYRFNYKSFDVQLKTGLAEASDWLFGWGLVWNRNKVGVRTEGAYYQPLHTGDDARGSLLIATGIEYVFTGGLIIQSEMLYNQLHYMHSYNILRRLYDVSTSPRVLSISEWSLAVNASYPITERLRAGFLSSFFVDYEAYTMSASLRYNLSRNFELFVNANYLHLKLYEKNEQLFAGSVRLRYYF